MALKSPLILLPTILMVSIVLVVVSGEKHWPDLSCHPAYDKDNWRKPSLAFNQKQWKGCQKHSADAEKGLNKRFPKCAKLCMLGSEGQLSQENGRNGGPLKFDISQMVNHLANENGYKDGHGGPQAEQLMEKVRVAMTGCWDKHQEIRSLSMYTETCDKWNPFLSCIDSAYGCK